MDGDCVIAFDEKGAGIGDQFFVERSFATGAGCGVIDGRIFVFVKAEAVDFGAIDPDDKAIVSRVIKKELGGDFTWGDCESIA